MNTAMRRTRDRTSNRIHNANAKGTPLQAVPHRQDSISGLSTPVQEHANIISEDGGLPVQEITRQFNGDGDLGEFFKDGTSGNAGAVRGSACAEDDTTATANDGEVSFEATEGNPEKDLSRARRVDNAKGGTYFWVSKSIRPLIVFTTLSGCS
jgi:hypothetical protein